MIVQAKSQKVRLAFLQGLLQLCSRVPFMALRCLRHSSCGGLSCAVSCRGKIPIVARVLLGATSWWAASVFSSSWCSLFLTLMQCEPACLSAFSSARSVGWRPSLRACLICWCMSCAHSAQPLKSEGLSLASSEGDTLKRAKIAKAI